MLDFLYFSLAVAAFSVTAFFVLLSAAVVTSLVSGFRLADGKVNTDLPVIDDALVDLADPGVDADYWQNEVRDVCPVADPDVPCCGKPQACEVVAPLTQVMTTADGIMIETYRVNKEEPRGA